MSDLPPAQEKYKTDILSWMDGATKEGDRFLQNQYGYENITKATRYIQGDQVGKLMPKDFSNFYSNRLGKITNDHVAAVTDIKAMPSYRSQHPDFGPQTRILNNLSFWWYMNNFVDLKLGCVTELSVPCGAAYGMLVFNQQLEDGLGDLDLIPLDPRDVLPVRPCSSISIQDSLGVIVRSTQTVNYLKARYPSLASQIHADQDLAYWTPRDTAMSRMWQKVATAANKLVGQGPVGFRVPGKEIRTLYVTDESLNETGTPQKMGYGPDDEEYTWSYEALPGEPLYPRGRCIVAGKDIIFYDGPNIYWHGKFPLFKLYSDLSFAFRDSYFSKSLIEDLIQHQDLINEIINGISDSVRKALRPGAMADARAVPKDMLEKLNTRRPGWKARLNPSVGGGIKLEEPPNLPPYVFEFLKFLVQEIEYLSGNQDMSNLARLRQFPSIESIEGYLQAMSPSTRLRGRLMEFSVRDLADMLKYGFFQFYDTRRRIQILGPDGMTLEDFDFDPGSLIPDDTHPLYKGMTRHRRAIKHARNFTIYMTSNSLLELSLVTRKLEYMQLRKMGEIDHTSFLEAMEVPDIDQVNERLSSELDQKIAMVQQMTAGVAGRPQSGRKPPHEEVKAGGRPTVSTS